MSENRPVDAQETRPETEAELRVEEGRLNPHWMENLAALLEAGEGAALKALLAPLHNADLADVVGALPHEDRVRLVGLLGEDFDYSVLTELDDSVRTDLIEALPNEAIAKGLAELDSDDAVYILEDIEEADRDDILSQLPAFERLSLKRSLDFPEESAGRRMQTEFIAIPPFWSVGQAIDYLRTEGDLPEEFHQLYVVDPGYNLMGAVPLDRLLRAGRRTKISEVMTAQPRSIEATLDQEEAARIFGRYDLVEVAVVDESRRLVGVLTIDDIVDVIHEEAAEDIHRLGRVGDEDLSDTVLDTVKSRITWLLVNLGTATLASVVIGFFDATIEQMVALAVLMPIVAAMGGNATTQTMTVTVRAIAMKELNRFNVARLITREFLVGLVNGVVFAILLGIITAFRFDLPELGVVIGCAIVVNMVVAGTAGILVPLALDKLKIDPAVASATFVMTITDVVGFFAFLSLAGWWFGLF